MHVETTHFEYSNLKSVVEKLVAASASEVHPVSSRIIASPWAEPLANNTQIGISRV